MGILTLCWFHSVVFPNKIRWALEDGIGQAGDDPVKIVGDVRRKRAAPNLKKILVNLAKDERLVGAVEMADRVDHGFRIEQFFRRQVDPL